MSFSKENYQHLIAERAIFQRFLDETPKSDIIAQINLKSRIEELEASILIAKEKLPVHEAAKAKITFGGEPVRGSYGIVADFGSKVMQHLIEAVQKLAASIGKPLPNMGPTPEKKQNQLLITAVAKGSFGFELEELQDQLPLIDEPSQTEIALGQVLNILQISKDGTDDELSELIADLDRKAVVSVHDLLEMIAKNRAFCSYFFKGHALRFYNAESVRSAAKRLADDNRQEIEEVFTGQFEGALPHAQTFEFQLAMPIGDQDFIKGKISESAPSAEVINQNLNQIMDIRVLKILIGEGKPKYILLNVPDLNKDVKS